MKLRLWLLALCLACLLAACGRGNGRSGGAAYSNEELCGMVLAYFQDTQDHDSGEVPVRAKVDREVGDDDVVIRLYEDDNGHTTTLAWYYIDRWNGVGHDQRDNLLDLSPYAPGE